MKLRTRIVLPAAPVAIAGSILAGPVGSQPIEGPDDLVACTNHLECGPDDPGPGDPGEGGTDDDCDDPEPDPDPDPDPDPQTPEVPEAEPQAPVPGKPNFTG